mgnify:CR=1 FL=1
MTYTDQITGSSAYKEGRYEEVYAEIKSVISDETFQIARFASVACMLHQAFTPRFFWTGFYLVDPDKPDELVVGPYQGTLGCLRIPFGKGVCGVAAKAQETVLVEDVHEFPGHIACDSRTNSEIVVPVFDEAGALKAVLDIDSEAHAAFDKVDRHGLEAICALVFGK